MGGGGGGPSDDSGELSGASMRQLEIPLIRRPEITEKSLIARPPVEHAHQIFKKS